MRYYIHSFFTSLYILFNKISNKYWYNYPFGKKPQANKAKYMEIFENAKRKSHPEIDAFEDSSNFRINQQEFHNLALHTQVVIKKSAINYQNGRLLYSYLSKYISDNSSANI